MAGNGRISQMDPLPQLNSDIWFEVITLVAGNWVNRKLDMATIRRDLVIQAGSAYEIAVDNGFHGTVEEWLESLKGKSAYQSAVELGQYSGTEAEWVAALEALYTVQDTDDGKFLCVQDGRGQWITLDKAMLGLDKVDNTADMDKPVSTAVQQALDAKANKDEIPDSVTDSLTQLGFVQDQNGDIVMDEGTIT